MLNLRTLRLLNVEPAVAALEAIGSAGMRQLILGRSEEVAACPWPAVVGSAALAGLVEVRVEAIDRTW